MISSGFPNRLGVVLVLLAVRAPAQIVPYSSTTVLDYSGGQATWAGTGQIIEEYPVLERSDGSSVYAMGLLQTSLAPSKTTITNGLYPSIIASPFCSVGNPSSDGKNVVFLVQSNAIDGTGTPNCTPPALLADQAPKDGGGYGIGACEGPITPNFQMTAANCRFLLPLTTPEIEGDAGYLDPVLIGTNLFIAHRNHGAVNGYTSASWQVVHFTIDFSTQLYPTNIQLVSALQPGNWPTNNVSNNCEQFYKPASAILGSDGQWTVYTQADQVSYSSVTVATPGNNTLDGGNSACVGSGATRTQSGLYSYNESNPASTWTQIWPQPATELVTAGPHYNSKGYAEYPAWFSYNDIPYLLFIAQAGSTDAAVDDCASLSPQCAPNSDNEIVILNLATGVASTVTNFFNPPSDLNTNYFPGDPQNGFGETARLSVSPTAQNFLFNLEDQTGRHWLAEFPLFYPGTPVASLPSAISISSAPNPAQFGSGVTITANVPTDGATGSVTFFSGASVLGVSPLTNGTATLSTAFLPAGSQTLVGRYDGNLMVTPSTSAGLTETVGTQAGGTFGLQQATSAISAAAIAVNDFNGDGIPDLAVSTGTGNELSLLIGTGFGTFIQTGPFGTESADPSISDSLAVGDLNGDGKQDVVIGLANQGAVSVLLGTGNASFQAGVHYAVDQNPNSVVLADFNGDGIPDIAAANGTSGDISVLLGNGDGTFQAAQNFAAGTMPVSLVAGDFNGDSHVDLAVSNPGSSQIAILLGNGDGTFQNPIFAATGSGAQQIAAADFNADGKLDLVAVTSLTSGFSILLGNGDGTFQTAAPYSAGNAFATYGVAVSDFNGDGIADLAISANGLEIFLGKGDGTFQPADDYPFPPSPTITPTSLAVGDFNRDGRADLAVAGQSSAGVLISLAAAPVACTYNFSPASITLDASGGTVPVQVTPSNPDCLWSESSSAPWLSAGPPSGNVTTIAISPNSTGAARSGTILIGGQSLLVSQDLTTQVYSDVPPTAYYFDAVDLLSTHGITTGCAPDEYCPAEDVTRAQMAVFIVRTVFGGDDFTYSPTPYFTDVPVGAFGFAWIQKLFELGITGGCSAGLFCPDADITRDQMAIFIIRMRYGTPNPPDFPATPYFTDVGPDTFGWEWIQRMREDNITSGCSATEYCPTDTVTRGDMAIFIMRGGFNALLPSNEPVLSGISPATLSVGSTGTFNVTGLNTNFVEGTTALAPMPGITVVSVTVISPTTLNVELAASGTATQQPVSVLAITGNAPGNEEAVLPNGLVIQ